jgi:serine/threonine-protein kinase RIO1
MPSVAPRLQVTLTFTDQHAFAFGVSGELDIFVPGDVVHGDLSSYNAQTTYAMFNVQTATPQ